MTVARWLSSGKKKWKAWLDAWVGHRETRFQRRGHGPSPRAMDEILDYYTRAAEYGPHPPSFVRLLRRNGLPDWPNPFPEGQEEHYHIHPLGFLAADLEHIALGWAESPLTTASPTSAPSLWPSVEESALSAYRARLREDDEVRARARVCWALAVLAGPLTRLRSQIHPHNLLAATADAVLRGPLLEFGVDADRVWSAAQRHGLAPDLKASEVWARMGGPDLSASVMSEPKPFRESIRQKNELDRLWREADARDRNRANPVSKAWLSVIPLVLWAVLVPFVSFEVSLIAGVVMIGAIALLASRAWRDFTDRGDRSSRVRAIEEDVRAEQEAAATQEGSVAGVLSPASAAPVSRVISRVPSLKQSESGKS